MNTKTVLKFEKSITEGHLITSYEDGVLTLDNGVKLELGAGITIEDFKIEGNKFKVKGSSYPKEVLPENIEEIMKATDYFTELVESRFIKIKREFSKGSLTSVFDDDYCYVVDRFGYMLTSIWFDDELQDVNAELRVVNQELKKSNAALELEKQHNLIDELNQELKSSSKSLKKGLKKDVHEEIYKNELERLNKEVDEVNKELKANKKELDENNIYADVNEGIYWVWANRGGHAYKKSIKPYVYDVEEDIKYIKEELGVDPKLSIKEIRYKVLVHNALIFYKKVTNRDQIHLANIIQMVGLYLNIVRPIVDFEVDLERDESIILGVCGYFDGAYIITHYGAPSLKLANGDAYEIKVNNQIRGLVFSYESSNGVKNLREDILTRLYVLGLLNIEGNLITSVQDGVLEELRNMEDAELKVNSHYVGVARISYDVFNHTLSKLRLKIDK